MKRQALLIVSLFLFLLLCSCNSDKTNVIFIPNAEALTAPVLYSPVNAATGLSIMPTLTWSTVTGATTYEIQVSTTSTFATTVADNSTLTSGSATFTTTLSNNTTYYWRANAKNSSETSPWSEIWRFTTSPGVPIAPTLSLPSNGSTSVSVLPTFSWSAVSGATTYRIQIATSSSFTTVLGDNSLSATSISVTNALASGTKYYWHVNATNSAGTSTWSSTWYFTTASSTTTGSLKVVNNSSYTIYYLYVSPSGATTWGSDQLSTYTILPGYSYTLNLIPGTYDMRAESTNSTYYWQQFNIPITANNTYTWSLGN